jgi:hypothetical protein
MVLRRDGFGGKFNCIIVAQKIQLLIYRLITILQQTRIIFTKGVFYRAGVLPTAKAIENI